MKKGKLKKYENERVSKLGYKRNSPYKNRPSLVIDSPHITMDGVDEILIGQGNNGQTQLMLPNSGDYHFPGATKVKETPIKKFQKGGIKPNIQKLGNIEFDSNLARPEVGYYVVKDNKTGKDFGVVRNPKDGSYDFVREGNIPDTENIEGVQKFYQDALASESYRQRLNVGKDVYPTIKDAVIDAKSIFKTMDPDERKGVYGNITAQQLGQRLFYETQDAQKALDTLGKTFKELHLKYEEGVGSHYQKGNDVLQGYVNLDRKQVKDKDLEDVAAHEYSHYKRRNKFTEREPMLSQLHDYGEFYVGSGYADNLFNRKNIEDNDHDDHYEETAADLDALRYHLKKQGVWKDPYEYLYPDIPEDKVKIDAIQKAIKENPRIKDQFTNKRLQRLLNEGSLIEALNTFSATDSPQSETQSSKHGGVIQNAMKKKYQQGGNLEKDILTSYLSSLSDKEQDSFVDSYSKMNPDEQYQTLMKCGGKVFQKGGVSETTVGDMVDSFVSSESLNTIPIPVRTQDMNKDVPISEDTASWYRMDRKFREAGDWRENDRKFNQMRKNIKKTKFYEKQDGGEIPIYPQSPRGQGNVETEGQESVMLPSGQLYGFEGPKHAQGGIPVNLEPGSKIYSEYLKVPSQVVETVLGRPSKKKMSYADISKKFPTKPYEDILNSPKSDEYKKAGAQLKLEKNRAILETLFSAQEMVKGKENPYQEIPMAQEGLKVSPKNVKFIPNGDGTVKVLFGNTFVETIPENQQFSYSLPQRQFTATDNRKQGRRTINTNHSNVSFTPNGDGTTKTLFGDSFIQSSGDVRTRGYDRQYMPLNQQKGFSLGWNPEREILGDPTYEAPSMVPEQFPRNLIEPSSTYSTGVAPIPIRQMGQVPTENTQPVLPTVKENTTEPVRAQGQKPKVRTKPRPTFGRATYGESNNGLDLANEYDIPLEDDYIGSEPIENDYIGSEPLVDERGQYDDQLPPDEVKKKRDWGKYLPGSKLTGTILDIALAASDKLDIDSPNYRDNRKYPLFTRFVNFDDKEVGRNHAAAIQEVQNSNLPEQVKQSRIAQLNGKYQDYQAKIDFGNAQRYQGKLEGDTEKLQTYMDRNVDQATQDLEKYREKKARINYLRDQFNAQRKSRMVNSVRSYLDYVDETNQKNQLLSENYRTNPFNEKIYFKGENKDYLAKQEQLMQQYASDPRNVSPLPNGGSLVKYPGGYMAIDKDGKITKLGQEQQ